MTLKSAVKSSFIAGLILIAPLAITLFVLKFLTDWAFDLINPLVRGTGLPQYTGNIELIAQIIAALLIITAITVIGYIAQQSAGRRMFGQLGRLVYFIPLVSTVYASIRQVASSLVNRDTAYQSVVLVEFPREDVYAIGFVTGEAPQEVGDVAGEDVYSVYVPHSPNPTIAQLLFLSEDQLLETDMSVRQGMRLVVTTGIGGDDESAALPPIPEE